MNRCMFVRIVTPVHADLRQSNDVAEVGDVGMSEQKFVQHVCIYDARQSCTVLHLHNPHLSSQLHHCSEQCNVLL